MGWDSQEFIYHLHEYTQDLQLIASIENFLDECDQPPRESIVSRDSQVEIYSIRHRMGSVVRTTGEGLGGHVQRLVRCDKENLILTILECSNRSLTVWSELEGRRVVSLFLM